VKVQAASLEGDCEDVYLLVTGSTSGMGEAIATQLSGRGTLVLVRQERPSAARPRPTKPDPTAG
jgi:NAD(P)-dependent dehydrogenase (short-subunit alcohol dehydrogenase family)